MSANTYLRFWARTQLQNHHKKTTGLKKACGLIFL